MVELSRSGMVLLFQILNTALILGLLIGLGVFCYKKYNILVSMNRQLSSIESKVGHKRL